MLWVVALFRNRPAPRGTAPVPKRIYLLTNRFAEVGFVDDVVDCVEDIPRANAHGDKSVSEFGGVDHLDVSPYVGREKLRQMLAFAKHAAPPT